MEKKRETKEANWSWSFSFVLRNPQLPFYARSKRIVIKMPNDAHLDEEKPLLQTETELGYPLYPKGEKKTVVEIFDKGRFIERALRKQKR